MNLPKICLHALWALPLLGITACDAPDKTDSAAARSPAPAATQSAKRQLSPSDFTNASNAPATPALRSRPDAAKPDAPLPAKLSAQSTDATPDAQAPVPPPASNNLVEIANTGNKPDANNAAALAADSKNTFVMDAMVGQVTGKPVYASDIFQGNVHETLLRLGATMPRLPFKGRAQDIIYRELSAKIDDELILAEAERDLTENQQYAILAHLQKVREQLINQYGNGAPTVADINIKRETGFDLAETLQRTRHGILTRQYLDSKINPRIHVTKRDIERYYADNYNQFNPPPSVTVRVILVTGERTRDAVEADLKAKVSFKDVAERESRYNREKGGLLVTSGDLSKFAGLRWDQVNEAVRRLQPGQTTPCINVDEFHIWVQLVEIESGKGKTLAEAALDIENRIRAAQFNARTREYRLRLRREGNYTPLEDMKDALLDVAVSRYARPS